MENHPEIIACNFARCACTVEALANLMNEYIADEMGGGMPYTRGTESLMLVMGLEGLILPG